MDCLGASIDLSGDKKPRRRHLYCYEKNNTNAKLLLNNFTNDPKYMNNIITGDKALTLMDKQTLVIVVDTQQAQHG